MAVIKPEIVGVAVQLVGPMVSAEPLIVVAAPTRPKVRAVCVAVPIFIATPVVVSKVGANKDVPVIPAGKVIFLLPS